MSFFWVFGRAWAWALLVTAVDNKDIDLGQGREDCKLVISW